MGVTDEDQRTAGDPAVADASRGRGQRVGNVHRTTRETNVEVRFSIDGTGRASVSTCVGFLDHMLDSLARHGLFDIDVRASGDLQVDEHHTVEDVAIALGQAVHQAVGEGRGIRRMGHAIVPMDDALALVAVDVSGRGVSEVDLPLAGPTVGGLKIQMVPHFFRSFSLEAKVSLHVRALSGANDHHKVEACFKALARALDWATQLDDRASGDVPSTKGVL
ncbi:MAG: imidazoleglycerol-phosphate dehydratase HisB [Chloroflexi bacterium]|nr:imidazoleglycerol-phosphate dehydratase HisB [Chloroflexota bacterium]